MTKAERNPNVQVPRRKRRLRIPLLLPDLAAERLKTPKNTSIHMLKTFLISRPRNLVRDETSGGVAELEVSGVKGVSDENMDKYAFVRICPYLF